MSESSNHLSLKFSSRINDPKAPLVFFVHGRAGTVDVMSTFRRAVPSTWNIVQVEAPLEDPIGGYSWWAVTDGSLNPREAEKASELLLFFREEFLREFELKPSFEVALGFSQGSGLLSVLAQKSPKLLSAIGILAGFVIPLDDTNANVFSHGGPEIFWAHGSKDPVIKLNRAKKGVSVLESWGLSVQFVTDEVEHKVGRLGMKALKDWLHKLGS